VETGQYIQKPLAFEEESLRRYCRFLSTHYGKPEQFTYDYLKWQYVDNPAGHAVGFDAFYREELVAHVATIPLKAVIFGKEEKWLLLVNAMTLPEHRRQGVSVGIADNIERTGREHGCTFIIGIANRNSTPAYVKGRQMELSTTLDARLGLGMPAREGSPGEHYDFKVLWDEKGLRWRLKKPGGRYWQKVEKGRSTLFAPSGRLGINTVLGHFPKSDVGEVLPLRAGTGMSLNLWIGKDPAIRWGRSPFIPIPDRLKPSPLNFLFKDLNGQKRSLLNRRIFFQCIDFDAF
jgi:GNAT superfamily N-acetyltransferase